MRYLPTLSLISILLVSSGCVQKEQPPLVCPPVTPTIIEAAPSVGTYISSPPVDTITHIPSVPLPPSPQEAIVSNNIFETGSISSPYLQGAYGSNYKLKQFINTMINKHRFDRNYLNALFSSVSRDTEALRKIGAFGSSKPTSKLSTLGSWDKYRANFLTSSRIEKGVKFWKENRYYLEKASHLYGVAPEYIIGIIGVETNFGGFTGKHKVLDALTSISIEFPKRSKFFTMQLENYLLMTRKERLDPRLILGSYAGAFGLSQFMPDSFRDYAVDHDGSGQINLFNRADAIGSVANFFKKKGKWNSRIPVAMQTYYNKSRFTGVTTGFRTRYSQSHMRSLGMRPTNNFYGYKGEVSLIKLSRYNKDEMWWGTPNFHAIARYNPKDHYAMAVHQLAQAIRKAYWKQ